MWHRAWVNGVDQYAPFYPESFRLVHNRGTGLLLHGARDWQDYRVAADITPHLVRRAGIAVRVQGMRRYYAVVLNAEGAVQIVRELDGTTVLAEAPFDVEFYRTYQLEIAVNGTTLTASVDGDAVLEAEDDALATGGIALVVDEGRTATQSVSITPYASLPCVGSPRAQPRRRTWNNLRRARCALRRMFHARRDRFAVAPRIRYANSPGSERR